MEEYRSLFVFWSKSLLLDIKYIRKRNGSGIPIPLLYISSIYLVNDPLPEKPNCYGAFVMADLSYIGKENMTFRPLVYCGIWFKIFNSYIVISSNVNIWSSFLQRVIYVNIERYDQRSIMIISFKR